MTAMPEVPKIDAQSEYPCLPGDAGLYCAETKEVYFPSHWQEKLTVLHSRACEGCWRMISTCSLCLLKCVEIRGSISVKLKI